MGRFVSSQWSTRVHPLRFAPQIDFAQKSFDDDRTALAVWSIVPEVPAIKEGIAISVITEAEVLTDEHEKLGQGGESVVYSVPGLHIPGLRFSLVYKRFRTPSPMVGGLRMLVSRREAQAPQVRRTLDQLTVWPLRIVERDGLVTGVLMRLIPSVFTHSVMSPSRRQLQNLPREVQFLMVPDRRVATLLRIPAATLEERVAVCLEFSRAVALLHGMGVVIGDINSRNALFSLRERPRVLLIDCDAYRIVGTIASRSQLESPDWETPERGALSLATDRYKLGLFILRVLTPGERNSINRAPEPARDVLGTRGIRLLRAALSTDPDGRPAAEEWVEYLSVMINREWVRRPAADSGRWR